MPGLISTATPATALPTSLTGTTAAPTTAGTGGISPAASASNASAINQMYQTDLGGAANYGGDTGSQYWQNLASNGTPLSTINSDMRATPEGVHYASTGQTERPVTAPINVPSIPVTNAAPASATASTENLQAPQMTIAGNIGNYLDPNSTTNQMLKTKALEAANGNGTLNSSMTDSAISNGIIANAQSMAQQDQGVYATGAGNNASMLTNTANSNAGLSNAVNLANSGAANQSAIQQAQLQSAQTITGMNTASQQLMTNFNNANRTQIQGSAAGQQIADQYQNALAAINSNTATDQLTKNTQAQSALTTAQAAMNDQGAMLNIQSLGIASNFNNLSVAQGG